MSADQRLLAIGRIAANAETYVFFVCFLWLLKEFLSKASVYLSLEPEAFAALLGTMRSHLAACSPGHVF